MERKKPRIDRITNLPEPIIGHILSLLPFKEAVRTSVLSKPWRRLWTYTTSIELDKSIIAHDANSSRWADVADSILSIFQGSPVTSCYLAWPSNLNEPDCINRLLRILLQSGIKKLKLETSSSWSWSCSWGCIYRHTIPLDLLCCQTLTILEVHLCYIPRFPQTDPIFNICRSLRALRLNNVYIAYEGDIKCLITSCKSLETLELIHCKGVRHLCICSSNIRYLNVVTSSAVTLCLEGATYLAEVTIFYSSGDKLDWEAQDLIQLLKLSVSVESLALIMAPSVTDLMPSVMPRISASTNLKRLEIDVCLAHAHTVSLLACLLKNSPYLKELNMKIDEQYLGPITEIGFWDRQSSFLCLTHHLVTAKLCFFSHYDYYASSFIKYLLANSPLLKSMHIDLLFKEDNVRMHPMKKASMDVEITVREISGAFLENVL